MPYAFIRDVPVDASQYLSVRTALGTEPPKGLITHLALRQDDCVRHIDVWDTEADWERFRDERLGPVIGQMMAAQGITEPPSLAPLQPIDVIDTWTG